MGTRQPELYAAALTTWGFAAIAVVLRLRVRRNKMNLGDYLSIAAFLFSTGFTFISLFKMRWGFGLHMSDIDRPPEEIDELYFKDLFIDMWFYTLAIGTSKFTILHFYWIMFQRSIIRWPIIILSIASACWVLARMLIIGLQCIPIQKFWTPSLPGHCMSPSLSLALVTIPHIILEFAILICPMIVISHLQNLHLRQKLAVIAMFTSGFLVCGCALGNFVNTKRLNTQSEDVTWDAVSNQTWAVADVNLALFSTCLPLLRPVLNEVGRWVARLGGPAWSSISGRSLQGTRTTTRHMSKHASRHLSRDDERRTESMVELTVRSPNAMVRDSESLEEGKMREVVREKDFGK
ncbi:hypothetical protein CC78DRAFT_73593 [Lojkania enalia]|uniref:Rhodopsin domain-containing protein n=1 Tax=Lojkania enalia TaxID=147567 RepID=A0A9P4K0X4_9PLEO|nr:hypothetical protein CC78DRAFT_73593 [Didymosphaeria enalia]